MAEFINNDLQGKKDSNQIEASNNISSLTAYNLKLEMKDVPDGIRNMLVNEIPELSKITPKSQGEFICQCIETLLSKPQIGIKDIIDFYQRAANNSDIKKIPLKYLFGSNRIKELKGKINLFDTKRIQIYLFILLHYMKAKGISLGNTGIYRELIKEITKVLMRDKNELEYILDFAVRDLDIFPTLLIIYFQNSSVTENTAIKYFMGKSVFMGREWTWNIRQEVSKLNKGNIFLYEEFKKQLKTREDKTAFFWRYNKKVFHNSEDYKNKYFSDALQCYLSEISLETNYITECLKALVMVIEKEIVIGKDTLERILKVYEDTLIVEYPGGEEEKLFKELSKIKKENKIQTTSDKIRIIKFGKELQDAASKGEVLGILRNTEPFNFEALGEKDYRKFLDWCFITLGFVLTSIEELEEIRSVFYWEKYSDVFYTYYEAIKTRLEKEFSLNFQGISGIRFEEKLDESLPHLIEQVSCWQDFKDIEKLFKEADHRGILFTKLMEASSHTIKEGDKEDFRILSDYILYLLDAKAGMEADIYLMLRIALLSILTLFSEDARLALNNMVRLEANVNRYDEDLLQEWGIIFRKIK